MTVIIFDIQRFSIHDGPGIRTTVFLKGCNMKCIWCHNPESQSGAPELMFYSEKCTLCGKCKQFCERAFTEKCENCGKCASVCASEARKLCGREVEKQEIMSIICRDMEFYKTSGGGVTFSGGEPLLQTDFLAELLKECKLKGIHTAVETAGCVSFECFEKVSDYVDLFLFDLKALDSDKHRELTGVRNELILQNAQKLKNRKANVIFRIPVVPEYNGNEISELIELAKPNEFELMPYHSFCKGKYDALGRVFQTADAKEPSEDYIKGIKLGQRPDLNKI